MSDELELPKSEDLVKQPILHAPWREPDRHWKTVGGETFNEILLGRRKAATPMPIRQWDGPHQFNLEIDGQGNEALDQLRMRVRKWREDLYPDVTRATRILLDHWASGHSREATHNLFFAQREAVETVIYLTEVGGASEPYVQMLRKIADDYSHGLVRLALRMATGTGKTAVMACLIGWYCVNRRHERAVSGGLARNVDRIIVVCPGTTVRARLQCLVPTRPDNIYDAWRLLPETLRPRLNGLRVDVVNFERLTPRENANLVDLEIAKMGAPRSKLASILGHKAGEGAESRHAMWSRVLNLGRADKSQRAVVFNDEGHHCWQRKEGDSPGVWMEALQELRTHPKIRFEQVIDVTATPIFIDPRRTHGYSSRRADDDVEHQRLFPWIVSEYALVEAMESGLVKIARPPDGDEHSDERKLRNLYEANGGKALTTPDGMSLVRGAAQLLYADYEKVYARWKQQGDPRIGDPVYIVVVDRKDNAEALFELLGGHRDESGDLVRPAHFDLLANVPRTGCGDDECEMRTILVLSKTSNPEATEGGTRVKGGELGIRPIDATAPTDEEIQSVLQTVGQPDKPGASVRCVVSVGMLTEGWDCQRVTHILGYRKFGSQLLCEQTLGRALRRHDYDNRVEVERSDSGAKEGRYPAEYATVMGVPFRTRPGGGGNGPPKRVTEVKPVSERAESHGIWVPAFEDYRLDVVPGEVRLDPDWVLEPVLSPGEHHGQINKSRHQGWMGEATVLQHNGELRPGYGSWLLAAYLVAALQRRDENDELGSTDRPAWLFADCLVVVQDWLRHPGSEGWNDDILQVEGAREAAGTAIVNALRVDGHKVIKTGVPRDTKEPLRSASKWLPFNTRLQEIAPLKNSELNVAACHSKLERKVAEQLDCSSLIAAITRNHGPERIEIPYRYHGTSRVYVPDFFLRMHADEPDGKIPHVVLEVKGLPDELSERKRGWTREWWIPSANLLGAEHSQEWLHVEVGPDDAVEDAIRAELNASQRDTSR